MSKRPRRPRQSRRPVLPDAKTDTTSAGPWQGLITAIATKMAEQVARTGSGEGDPDAELLEQCAIVNKIKVQPFTLSSDDWESAVLRASSLRALTLPGLRAKLEIALLIVGVHPESGEEGENFDRMVLWLTLAEVLALVDDAQG